MQRIVPWLGKKLFSTSTWNYSRSESKLYLTFDDGPHPEITPWVLAELKKHNAKATFFCLGKNVEMYPEIYRQIIAEGHNVGNHTYSHLKGWTTSTNNYLRDFIEAEKFIKTNLFRPPYGKIKRSQQKHIEALGYKTIMWDCLSKDYNRKLSTKRIWSNITKCAKNGSIIVFHDSEKAFKHLKFALPKLLEEYGEKGFTFEKIAVP